MFDYLSRAFSRLMSVVGGSRTLNPEQLSSAMDEVRTALLEADVPLDVSRAFVSHVESVLKASPVPKALNPQEHVAKVVYDELVTFMGGAALDPQHLTTAGTRLLVVGLQGSGKTTTVAKIARFLHTLKPGIRILVGSVDFQRPAAVSQLSIMAERAGCAVYVDPHSDDPVAATRRMREYARGQEYDVILLDTAGRLHTDENLMHQLQEVRAAFEPTHTLLVLDSMTGQESLRVAREFDAAVGFSYACLTKLDSDARGGAAFAFRYALSKPILFVGNGEHVGDLERFYPDRIASRMMGFGDLQTLLERAREKVRADEQARLQDAMLKGTMTLEEFGKQLTYIQQLGSLSGVMRFMPASLGGRLSEDDIARGERELRRFQAIISSMTPRERVKPAILNPSRKQRIARGAGVAVGEIDKLVQQFMQMQAMMKQLQRFGGLGSLLRSKK